MVRFAAWSLGRLTVERLPVERAAVKRAAVTRPATRRVAVMWTAALCAAVLTGCAGPATPSASPPQDALQQAAAADPATTAVPAAESPEATEGTVPITFEAKNGKTLPVPMVVASIGGVETRLILDTGASHHALTADLARAAKVGTIGEAETGQAHHGTVVVRPLARFELSLGGRELSIEEAVQVPAPPPFAALGIGGFISPQRLAGDGAVVLDLPKAELHLFANTNDGQPWASPPQRWHDNKPFVEVTIDDRKVTFAELDTGGSTTELHPAFANVGLIKPKCLGGTDVAGNCGKGAKATGTVMIGDATFGPMPLDVIEHTSRLPDGADHALLGMDALKHCVVAIEETKKLRLRCTPPP